jgi:hypothetical protein
MLDISLNQCVRLLTGAKFFVAGQIRFIGKPGMEPDSYGGDEDCHFPDSRLATLGGVDASVIAP